MNDDIFQIKEEYWSSWNNIKENRFSFKTSWQILDKLTFIADKAIKSAFELLIENTKDICIIALGGYAREEMCPFSDIDIMILHDGNLTSAHEQFISNFTALLWDMGLYPGIQIREKGEIQKAAFEDETIKTSMIDNRFLCGDYSLCEAFRKIMFDTVLSRGKLNFLLLKINDVRKRMKKYRDSIYRIEPNIKEGQGGIRDINTINWITKVLYDSNYISTLVSKKLMNINDYDELMECAEFLYRVRNELHYFHNRKYDVLNMESQKIIAENLNYTETSNIMAVELFLRDYYKIARKLSDITHRVFDKTILNMILSDNLKKPKIQDIGCGFFKYENTLTIKNKNVFIESPISMIHIFTISAMYGLKISDATVETLRDSLYTIDEAYLKRYGYIFLRAISLFPLSSKIVTNMVNTGFFNKFIPEFSELICKAQFDTYHHYTVDEHTILALKFIDNLTNVLPQRYSSYQEAFIKCSRKDLLSLSIILHDIGKGQGKNHSVVGAKMSKIICKRLGMKLDDIDTISNLVLHHLLMSHISQRRDIHDIDVVTHFVSFLNNREELRLLYLLTYADSNAVGGKIFNAWKDTLITELYQSADNILDSENLLVEFSSVVQTRRSKIEERISDDYSQVDMYHTLDDEYIFANKLKHVLRHISLASNLKNGIRTVFESELRKDLNCMEFTICTFDNLGLLKKLAGVFASFNLNILGAQIYTFNKNIVIDIIQVSSHSEAISFIEDKVSAIKKRVEEVISGTLDIDQMLNKCRFSSTNKKKRVVPINKKVAFDNDISPNYTIIDVYGEDYVGLLYDILNVFENMKINVQKAKISTDVDRIVDSFYVIDEYGIKIESPQALDKLRGMILNAI